MQGQVPRILLRSVNWLGDAVMITPALQRLREAQPNAHITLLTHEKLVELWQGHPSINSVLTYAASESVWSIARQLKKHKFDTALILPNSPRSALESWWARIPKRIGYARPWRNWSLTHTVPPRETRVIMRKRSVGEISRLNGITRPSRRSWTKADHASRITPFPQDAHQIHEYLNLAAALGADTTPIAPHLHVASSELQAVATRFRLQSDAAKPFFGLNPGAEYGLAKRWPAERFISAAVEIQRQTGCRWLIFGGPADRSIAREIENGIQQAREPTPAGES